jgi:hypothetical protein
MRANTLLSFLVLESALVGCKNDSASSLPPQTPATSSAVTSVQSAPAPTESTSEVAASPGASATATPSSAGSAASEGKVFGFDSDAPNTPPSGFSFGRTGKGKVGKWIVLAQPDAPSKGNVLAQVDADDTDYRFPVAVANEPSLRDARVRVRCKPVSGKTDQACGLVFRYQDENNYLLTRANALENNVRLYTVKEGNRRQIASYSGTVKGGVWHELQIEARGDQIQVSWDGAKVLDHKDDTFMNAGRPGIWTKADSVTYFDDLKVEGL